MAKLTSKSKLKTSSEQEEVTLEQEEELEQQEGQNEVETEAQEEQTPETGSEELKDFISDEVTLVEGATEQAVTLDVAESAPVAPQQKQKVRIVTNVDHKCCIGGNYYTFRKGVQQNVPVNVKKILQRAGLLAPL